MNEIERKYIKLRKVLEECHDSLGIYPMSITKDGVTKERTEWQNGWNECVIKMHDSFEKAYVELEENESDEEELFLILSGVCFDSRNKKGELFLNMNDTFWYSCADAEEVPKEKIREVVELFKLYGYAGITYWVSKQRNDLIPQIKKYAEEVAYVKEKESLRKRY